MRRRSLLLSVITGILVFGLTGCGHEHVWVDATCEKAKYCEICGETDGEPLSHVWVDATYTDPKTCSLCGSTEGEPLPAPYCAENNIAFDSLADMDLPFDICFEENGERTDLTGMWMDVGMAHYTFGEVTCEPAEQEGYVKITLPCEIDLSALIYADAELSNGAYTVRYTYPLFNVADYYTGICVPSRNLHGSDKVDLFKEYEWNGASYSIEYSKEINLETGVSDWEYERESIYHKEWFGSGDFVMTIIIPEDYDGAVLYIIKNGLTVSFSEETTDGETSTDAKDEYLLDKVDPENYIFYRLSDLME